MAAKKTRKVARRARKSLKNVRTNIVRPYYIASDRMISEIIGVQPTGSNLYTRNITGYDTEGFWARRTIEECVEAAKELLDNPSIKRDTCIIVKVCRVVRKASSPVIIEEVEV